MGTEKKRILVVGDAQMDMFLPVQKIPLSGETVEARGNISYSPGGKGANAAVAFAKLGSECVFATRLGQDSHGESLFSYYQESGIDVSHIMVDRHNPTSFSAIMLEPDGEKRTIAYPGAGSALTDADVEKAFMSFPNAVYLQLGTPFDIVLSATRYAKEKNIPVFMDGSVVSCDTPFEKLPPIEVFSPNEVETEALTGIAPQGNDATLRALLQMTRMIKAKYYVIKLGPRGSFVYDGRYYHVISPYPAQVIDKNAAGDAYTAALTLRYLETADIKESARFASAVSAITVSKKGSSSAIPTIVEAEAFMQKHAL